MLMVKTVVKSSEIHGLGLFAAEDIPKGVVVWKFKSDLDLSLSKKEFVQNCSKLDSISLLEVLTYWYKRGGRFYNVTDNAKFINHSEKGYNLVFRDDNTEIAARDIKAGEELLENYTLNYDSDDYFFHEEDLEDPSEYLKMIMGK